MSRSKHPRETLAPAASDGLGSASLATPRQRKSAQPSRQCDYFPIRLLNLRSLSSAVTRIGIALVGPGLVGRIVLGQFASPALRPHFKVVSISNSRYTVFNDGDEEGDSQSRSSGEGAERLLNKLPPSSARAGAAKGAIVELAPADLVAELVRRARCTGSHIILVDCTASEAVPRVYENALVAGISVVTPNKVAVAGPAPLYRSIIEAQAGAGAGHFYCEGACGAGLPVMSTLTDLVRTGDDIIKIEAVLSGTLSYIFNQYSTLPESRAGESTLRFSEIVCAAHQNGHTVRSR